MTENDINRLIARAADQIQGYTNIGDNPSVALRIAAAAAINATMSFLLVRTDDFKREMAEARRQFFDACE